MRTDKANPNNDNTSHLCQFCGGLIVPSAAERHFCLPSHKNTKHNLFLFSIECHKIIIFFLIYFWKKETLKHCFNINKRKQTIRTGVSVTSVIWKVTGTPFGCACAVKATRVLTARPPLTRSLRGRYGWALRILSFTCLLTYLLLLT